MSLCQRYVIDTNVLIAASAIDSCSPIAQEATPEDPDLRQRINEWLFAFEQSDSRLVLDGQNKIFDEYENKLGFNDYGIQVVMHKWSTAAVDNVELRYDADGHAYLDESLSVVVHDRSDRKMVAAVLEALNLYGECQLANAADTDWYDWATALSQAGVQIEQIIHDWAYAKWQEKKARGH